MTTRTTHPDHNEEGYWKLIRNAAKCETCGDVVESNHRHDYRKCGCGSIAVDGGLAYIRRTFNGPYTNECVWERMAEAEVIRKIEYYENMDKQYGPNTWVNSVLAGKRLLKEWYDKSL